MPLPVTHPLLPPDITVLDLAALAWFLGVWGSYTLVQDRLLTRRVGINQHLALVRTHWIARMLERDVRIMDSQLVGHTMNSATFFASTTMLVLAGLLGSFGAIEHAHEIIGGLAFTVKTSRGLFEMKMLLLVLIFAFAFFKFTWALRQFNYCIALIGSAPEPPLDGVTRATMAATIGGVLSLAVMAFNEGLRAYYFAIAALAWMIHPWALVAASAGVVVILVRRQAFSRAERLIRTQADALNAAPDRPDAASPASPERRSGPQGRA